MGAAIFLNHLRPLAADAMSSRALSRGQHQLCSNGWNMHVCRELIRTRAEAIAASQTHVETPCVLHACTKLPHEDMKVACRSKRLKRPCMAAGN